MRPAALLVALWLLPIALPAAEGDAAGNSRRVLTGTYTSAFNDRPGRLRVTFVAGEERGRWRVTAEFYFNSRWRTWTGTADGSFDAGRISGLVRDEDGNRAFTFHLERDKKDRFKGIHAEVIGGRERKTGTLSLKS